MTDLRRPGDKSRELEFDERQATEESLDAIKKLLAKTRRVSAGGAQNGLAVTSSAVTNLAPPSGATEAEIYVRTASVVFKRDGVAPTATAGIQADPADIILLEDDELQKFGAIAVSASATLDVAYFKWEGA